MPFNVNLVTILFEYFLSPFVVFFFFVEKNVEHLFFFTNIKEDLLK